MTDKREKHLPLRGILTTAAATAGLALTMFLPRVFTGQMALGSVFLLVVAWGILDMMGRLPVSVAKAPPPTEPIDLGDAPGWLRLVSGFDVRLLWIAIGFLAAGAGRVSVIGTLGATAPWSGPLLFGVGAASVVVAKLRRRPFDGNLHEGLLVFSLATATIMATLGSHGLWDCWETHYGEVARRQLEQDDWISLYWENKWFYSKPVLIFWMMNLGMALFGVDVLPDQISTHVEWGVRFFVGVLSIAVIYGIYALIARRISKRAGLITAVVLSTSPLFAFMARQAITDPAFVGFMTLAVVFFLFGLTAEKGAVVRPLVVRLPRTDRVFAFDSFHGLVLGYVVASFTQFVYLATRSAGFVHGSFGHGDVRIVRAVHELTRVNLSNYFTRAFGMSLGGAFDLSLDWLLLGIAFALPFGLILFSLRKERRVSTLAYHAMYICLALSVMAKGLPGLVLPILGLVGTVFVRMPWRQLRRPLSLLGWFVDQAKRLDVLRGVPMFLLTAAPWYVAMYLRHGQNFINRFFIHDHLKRLSAGVHGDTGTFSYFLEQFAYAAFPWAALFPFAVLSWPMIARDSSDTKGETPRQRSERLIRLFCASWALLGFALFSMMVTKFHHYTFPLVIPAAILIGLFIDDIWTGRIKRVGPIVVVALAVILAIALDLATQPNKPKGVYDGYAQLVGLFIYKYKRSYPEGDAFDFQLPLIVFSILFAVVIAGWLVPRIRRVAIVATIAAGLAFGHWLTQHYMVQLAPHWTQKHIIEEYYSMRRGDEKLVAFQMNWKGENFYTGNSVVVHSSTKNKNFEKWCDKHRGERHFFITEHARFKRMSRRAEAASGPFIELTDTCNKYLGGYADEL